MYICCTYTVAAHVLYYLCCKCGVAAIFQECAVAEYVLVYGEIKENISFFRHEVGVGVRFGVGIKKKIMLFSLSFYFFPLLFGGDEVQT